MMTPAERRGLGAPAERALGKRAALPWLFRSPAATFLTRCSR